MVVLSWSYPTTPDIILERCFSYIVRGGPNFRGGGGGGGNCLLAQLLLDYSHFLLMTFILSALHCVFVQVQELCQVVDAELGYAEGIKLWNPTSKVIG